MRCRHQAHSAGRKTTGLGGGAAPRSGVGQRPARGLVRWRIPQAWNGKDWSSAGRQSPGRPVPPKLRQPSRWARTAGPEGKVQTRWEKPRPGWSASFQISAFNCNSILRATLPGSHLALKMTDCTVSNLRGENGSLRLCTCTTRAINAANHGP